MNSRLNGMHAAARHTSLVALVLAWSIAPGLGAQSPAAPPAPPKPVAPPPSAPAAPATPSAQPAASDAPNPPPKDREHAVDQELMKKAIDRTLELYNREAKKFTETNSAKAQAEYEAARAKWDAQRKERNRDTGRPEDRNRNEEQEKRRKGEKPPPPPKKPDFETWAERMKAEVRAERERDPESGKKDRLLISNNHQLNCKAVQDLITKYRNSISDDRIKALLRQAFEQYEQLWLKKVGLAPDDEVIDP